METNNTKTKVMVFLPGRIHTCFSEDACLSQMDALHRSSKMTGKVECHICRKNFQKLSLASHFARQHGVFRSHLLAGADACQPVDESKKL